MTQIGEGRVWMFTIPQKTTINTVFGLMEVQNSYHILKRVIVNGSLNPIKWIIAKEEGHTGYCHWQVRIKTEGTVSLAAIRAITHGLYGHVEEAQDKWEYEKKECQYWCSWEEPLAKLRYGKLTAEQALWKELLKQQSDRQVLVIYDKKGRHGKSWFTKHMYLNHNTAYLPSVLQTAERILQFGYKYRKAQTYIIDIVRTQGITASKSQSIWTAVETLKDGWTMDARYESRLDLRTSPSICIMTNSEIPKELLSDDRWIIRIIS